MLQYYASEWFTIWTVNTLALAQWFWGSFGELFIPPLDSPLCYVDIPLVPGTDAISGTAVSLLSNVAGAWNIPVDRMTEWCNASSGSRFLTWHVCVPSLFLSYCCSPPSPRPRSLWVCACTCLSLIPPLPPLCLPLFRCPWLGLFISLEVFLSLSAVPLCSLFLTFFFHFTPSDGYSRWPEVTLSLHFFLSFFLLVGCLECFRSLGNLDTNCWIPRPCYAPGLAGGAPEPAGTSLRFAACRARACPLGLRYLIWDSVTKPQRCLCTFWATSLACRVGAARASFPVCTPARVRWELYYGNDCFCLCIFPCYSSVLIYFHLRNVGIFFRVLAFWLSGKPQINPRERNGKASG